LREGDGESGEGTGMSSREMAIGQQEIGEQDRLIAEAVEREEPRLRRFIRGRVLDLGDAEDVLQDVFYELTETYRMMRPVEQVTAWMFRVARNRITDLFRRRKAASLSEAVGDEEGGGTLEDLLPSPGAGPDAVFARGVMMDAIEEALEELPESQREVFVAHELMGRSFQEIAEETGVGVNTLLSRKRYAVLHLRERLREMDETLGEK
jgi:RNA polymerase sigma factor (sigma-70 family)